MQRTNLILSGVIITALILGGLLLSNRNNNQFGNDNQLRSLSNQELGSESESPLKTSIDESKYAIYTSEILEANSDKRRILYFYANWCPTCRPLDNDLKSKADQIPDGVIILRVSYNDSDTTEEEKALASRYGVNYQHTFVEIDSNGDEVQQWNGGQFDSVISRIKK